MGSGDDEREHRTARKKRDALSLRFWLVCSLLIHSFKHSFIHSLIHLFFLSFVLLFLSPNLSVSLNASSFLFFLFFSFKKIFFYVNFTTTTVSVFYRKINIIHSLNFPFHRLLLTSPHLTLLHNSSHLYLVSSRFISSHPAIHS